MIREDIIVLYKYRKYKIDEEGKNWTKEILQDQKLWHATMSSFNDPFEGIVEVDKAIGDGALLGHVIHRHLRDGHSIEEALKIVQQDYLDGAGGITQEVRDRISDVCNEFHSKNNTLGVLSLTEDPLSILMWSHYGDSHKGICIGFEREETGIMGNDDVCKPVQYSSVYPHPTVNDLLMRDGTASKLTMQSKANQWAYEKEWRLCRPNAGLGPLPGPMKEIILGCRWDDSKTDEIKLILNSTGVEMYKAEISPGEYSLKKTHIETL